MLKVDGIHVILLDNMDCPTMEQAVQLRDRAGRKGQVELEASGGVTLETVRSIASTGVERIAVGAITHSAPALDIGLDIESVGHEVSPPFHGHSAACYDPDGRNGPHGFAPARI